MFHREQHDTYSTRELKWYGKQPFVKEIVFVSKDGTNTAEFVTLYMYVKSITFGYLVTELYPPSGVSKRTKTMQRFGITDSQQLFVVGPNE